LLITQKNKRYFDSNLAITKVEHKAVGMFSNVADYILEMNTNDVLGKIDHIYNYANNHASRISKEYDIFTL